MKNIFKKLIALSLCATMLAQQVPYGQVDAQIVQKPTSTPSVINWVKQHWYVPVVGGAVAIAGGIGIWKTVIDPIMQQNLEVAKPNEGWEILRRHGYFDESRNVPYESLPDQKLTDEEKEKLRNPAVKPIVLSAEEFCKVVNDPELSKTGHFMCRVDGFPNVDECEAYHERIKARGCGVSYDLAATGARTYGDGLYFGKTYLEMLMYSPKKAQRNTDVVNAFTTLHLAFLVEHEEEDGNVIPKEWVSTSWQKNVDAPHYIINNNKQLVICEDYFLNFIPNLTLARNAFWHNWLVKGSKSKTAEECIKQYVKDFSEELRKYMSDMWRERGLPNPNDEAACTEYVRKKADEYDRFLKRCLGEGSATWKKYFCIYDE